MSIIERKPFKNFRTLPALRAFAYVKKETHLEVYELCFASLWSLDSSGNCRCYAILKLHVRVNQNTLNIFFYLMMINK
jgi:hypothetical protein